MAKQIINIGAGFNTKDGDTVRDAFNKVNQNFTELYNFTDLSAVAQDILPATTETYDLGSSTHRWGSLYVSTNTIYIGDKALSINASGGVEVDGVVIATPGGAQANADWRAVSGPAQILNKPTFGASNGLTATTDVNGNVNVGFSGILYVGSQTQYGFEEIVDESGPSPVYSSRLSLPLTTEFLGGDISLTAWGPGVNVTVRDTDTLNEYSWSFRNDGTLIAPSAIAFGDGNRTNINQVNNNFVIATNTGPGEYNWTFDDLGNLTLPGGAVIDTNYDGAGGTTSFWGAPGQYIDIRGKIADNIFGGGMIIHPDGKVDILAQNSEASANWSFNVNGNLTVPDRITFSDNTWQSTAFVGTAYDLRNSPTGNLYVTLDDSGTINTPLLLPKTFTAVLNPAHYVGEGTLVLEGAAWEYTVAFQVNPNGTVQTMIDNIPWVSNPGYVDGLAFEFVEADHGIPGYTFTLTLTDVQNPGPMMYTANIAVNPPPVYPSTVKSLGAIKLTADTQSWVFGTDGDFTAPGDITAHFFIGQTLQITDAGAVSSTYAGDLPTLHVTGNVGNGLTLGADGGLTSWLFKPDGSITFPDNTIQTTAFTGAVNSITQVIDNNATVNTSETLTTNNLYTNPTDFVSDLIPNGFDYVFPGLSQRNETQIEVNLFVPPAGDLQILLTGLALGRTVVATYSTASGTGTITGPVSQAFTVIAQTEPTNGWYRVAGRIDGIVPEGYTGLIDINFPVTSTVSHTWTFGDDGSITYPGDVKQSYQDATQCPPNTDTVIYTATGQYQHAIKLFVMVEGFTDGGGTSWDTQACDVIAVKGYNNNIVHVTTYGVTYTGAGAIATFDGQWNATTNRIEITCRPAGATNSVVASVHAIEMNSND